MNKTILITGGTSGIGEALAHECAKHGHDLVLTSRDAKHVQEMCETVKSRHGVEAVGIASDLTLPQAPDNLKIELQDRGIELDGLINDAGMGARGKFVDIPLQKHLELIHLNIEALTRLCHLFLPDFVRRGHGRVMNLGSIAGFQPGPQLAVYHATKAYVVSLSEAISEELKDTKVTVTCLCPGPTDTHFFDRADAENTKVATSDQMLMDPAKVAEGGYEAMMKGERVFIPGGMNKAMTFMRRLMPDSAQAKFNKLLYSES